MLGALLDLAERPHAFGGGGEIEPEAWIGAVLLRRLLHHGDGRVTLVLREMMHHGGLIDGGVTRIFLQSRRYRLRGAVILLENILRRVGAGKAGQIEQRFRATRIGLDGLVEDFEGGFASFELQGHARRVVGEFRVGGIRFENGPVMLQRLPELSRRLELQRGAVLRHGIRVRRATWREEQVRFRRRQLPKGHVRVGGGMKRKPDQSDLAH